jgi:hypothetical protein
MSRFGGSSPNLESLPCQRESISPRVTKMHGPKVVCIINEFLSRQVSNPTVQSIFLTPEAYPNVGDAIR